MDSLKLLIAFSLCFNFLSCGPKMYPDSPDSSDTNPPAASNTDDAQPSDTDDGQPSDSNDTEPPDTDEIVRNKLDMIFGVAANPPQHGYIAYEEGHGNEWNILRTAATENATWVFGPVRFPGTDNSFFVGSGSSAAEILRDDTASQQHFLGKYDTAGALMWGYGITVHTTEPPAGIQTSINDNFVYIHQLIPTASGLYLKGKAPAHTVMNTGNATIDFADCSDTTCEFVLELNETGTLISKQVGDGIELTGSNKLYSHLDQGGSTESPPGPAANNPAFPSNVVSAEITDDQTLRFILTELENPEEIHISENFYTAFPHYSLEGHVTTSAYVDFHVQVPSGRSSIDDAIEISQDSLQFTVPATDNLLAIAIRVSNSGELMTVFPLVEPNFSRDAFEYFYLNNFVTQNDATLCCINEDHCVVYDENYEFQNRIDMNTTERIFSQNTSEGTLFAEELYFAIEKGPNGFSKIGDMYSLHSNRMLAKYTGKETLDWVTAIGTAVTNLAFAGDDIVNVFDAIDETFYVGTKNRHQSITVPESEMHLYIARINKDTGALQSVLSAAHISSLTTPDFSQAAFCPDITLDANEVAPYMDKSPSKQIVTELWKFTESQIGVGDWQMTESNFHQGTADEASTVAGTFTTIDGISGEFQSTWQSQSSDWGSSSSSSKKMSLSSNDNVASIKQWTNFSLEASRGTADAYGMEQESGDKTESSWRGTISTRYPTDGLISIEGDSSGSSDTSWQSETHARFNNCDYGHSTFQMWDDPYPSRSVEVLGHEYESRYNSGFWFYLDGVCQYKTNLTTYQNTGECP